MAEKINIADLEINTADLESSNATILTQLAQLKESQKELRKETGNLTNANAEQSKQYVKQDAQIKDLSTTYNQQKAVLAESTTSVKGLTDALTRENKSIDSARKNNKELIKARNQINSSTKNGRKAIDEINKKLDQNNEFIKTNSSALERQKINIGNYASALDNAIPGLGRFATLLQTGADKSRIFGTALKAIPIFLILSGIVALGKAFASTQSGLDEINTTLAPLRGGFQSVIGIIQDISLNVFSQLSDRWTVAKNKVLFGINQLRVAWNNLTGDIEESEALQEYGRTLENEITTAQERLNEKTKELNKIWEGAGDRIKQASKDYETLEQLTISIEEKQIELVRRQGELNRQYEQARERVENVNLSFEERQRAAINALNAQNELEKLSIGLSDLKIERKKLENSFNDTSRQDLLELAQLEAERENAAAEAAGKRTTVANQLRAIQKQAADEQKQAVLDQIELENQLLEKRLKKQESIEGEIADARRLAQNIRFQEEILAIEEQGASELAIRLLQIEQERVLRKQQAEEQIEDKTILARQLQLIDDQANQARAEANEIAQDKENQRSEQFYGNVATLVGKNSELGKAASVAQTTISTFQGAREAFKALAGIPVVGPTLGAAAAGAAIASGLSDVRRITAVKTPKAEKGALIELGGKRHSQGGTTVFDESGNPLVEAEKGEVLGIMNRNAARLFMEFNNQNRDGGYSNIFSQFAMSGRSGGHVSGMNDKRMVSKLESLERTIENKPVASVNVDQDGFETGISKGFQKDVYLNKKFNG